MGLHSASSVFFLHFPRGLIFCLNAAEGRRTGNEKDSKDLFFFYLFQFPTVAFQFGTGNLHLLIAVNKMNVRFLLYGKILTLGPGKCKYPRKDNLVFLEIYVLQITGVSTCCSSGANLNQNSRLLPGLFCFPLT